jgi:hypothetical protein
MEPDALLLFGFVGAVAGVVYASLVRRRVAMRRDQISTLP